MLRVAALAFLLLAVHGQWIVDPEEDSCTTPDRKEGTCLPIYSCQTMLDALDKIPQPLPPEIRDKLKAYQCGFEGKRPKICCPPTIPSFVDSDDEEPYEAPDVSQHRNLKLLPKQCGYLDTTDKIVNGNLTSLFEFPWMALLSYKTNNGPDFKCGGTIINKRYILTAAHCLEGSRWPLVGVRVGDHNIRTANDCETDKDTGEETCAPPYQDLSVQKIIVHPQYARQTFSNDIGLIRVSSINLSLENSRPVCLPLAQNRNYNFTGRNLVVTGWGYTEKGRPSPVLLKVTLPAIPLKECARKYQEIQKLALSPSQLCAGGKSNSDSCAGDSGGPLHAIGTLHGDNRFVQQGIVSFGPRDCGNQPIPGVYTRVASYMDWLLDNMKP